MDPHRRFARASLRPCSEVLPARTAAYWLLP